MDGDINYLDSLFGFINGLYDPVFKAKAILKNFNCMFFFRSISGPQR